MKTTPMFLLICLLGTAIANAETEKETRYLGFQIFTYHSADPKIAGAMNNGMNVPLIPGSPALRDYVLDVKQRIGTVGSPQTRLAVILGPLSFEQTDADVTKFVDDAFKMALETDLAVGFHIDDSIFWSRRKDLWSDPKNVEALDWDGTPNTGRRLDWSRTPTAAPPQMCFNSPAIQQLVRSRSTLIGEAIQAGVKRLQQRNRPELFAGVIAGWETMIGQDFETGKYLGYRALLNRGFSREHPPQDIDLEREKVVHEFIELWTAGLAKAGVPPQKLYSHTAFLSRRSFGLGDKKNATYSQHNHFATPSVAFGEYHRPGFSTYPQPGIYDDIYEQLATRKQVGWASSEGTNMQPSSGPGQTGMTMETYLAKMYNHGASLVDIFSWGIGGEAMKNMNFRVVTESEEAISAYRKFLRGDALIEAKVDETNPMERFMLTMRRIQKDLPAWIQNADDETKQIASALMQQLKEQMTAKKFEEAGKIANSVVRMMDNKQPPPDSAEALQQRVKQKIEKVQAAAQEWQASGRDVSPIASMMNEKVKPMLESGDFMGADEQLDRVLAQLQQVPEAMRQLMRHKLDSSFVVFRDKVQQELNLTPEQIAKLEVVLPEVMQFFKKLNSLDPQSQDAALKAYRPQAHDKLAALLQQTLNENQLARLLQIERQRDQLFGGESGKALRITEDQQHQFMPLIMQTQRKIEALMKEIPAGGNPDEVRTRVLQARQDLETQLEALLTDAQKQQWKEMRGKPMELSDIFDFNR